MNTALLLALLPVIVAPRFQDTAPPAARAPIQVAIALFPDVQIIDFSGPWETFGQAGYRVHTVAASREPIVTNMGMRILADHTFADSPAADVLVIPGGGIPHRLPEDDALVVWLRERAKEARFVLTVCNGAFVLGPAGLAQGRKLTTNAGMIGHLEASVEGATAVYDQRFVADGKLVTAGGLTAGIDAALHLVERIDSRGRAQEVANKLEYDWDPAGTYARSKLADFGLACALDVAPPLRKRVLRYEGDERRWLAEFLVRRECTLTEFAAELEAQAALQGWTSLGTRRDEREIEHTWRYPDHRGLRWRLVARFTATSRAEEHRLTVELEREEA